MHECCYLQRVKAWSSITKVLEESLDLYVRDKLETGILARAKEVIVTGIDTVTEQELE
jgi:hypothetical protein